MPLGPAAQVNVDAALQVALEAGVLVRLRVLQDEFGGVALPRHGDQDALLDGHGQDGVAAVVDVLADEVDPAGHADHDGGAAPEPLLERSQEAGDAGLVRIGGNGGVIHCEGSVGERCVSGVV